MIARGLLACGVTACVLAGCASGADLAMRSDGGIGGGDARAGSDGSAGCAAPLALCGSRCVDTSSDVEHCGACDRTCVVPGASAACVEGECAVGACETGTLDCNGDPEDGCEHEDACAEAAACTTSCGSTGALSCADRCAPVCAPPAELCNLADDDCDGACEAGLPGCRVAVHRSNGSSGHFYTASREEAACCGMTVESYDFYHLHAGMVDGTQPLFRCLASGGYHFYTTDTGCEAAGALEGTLGFIGMTERCGAVPLYRLRHPGGDHFYTHSAPERDSAVGLGYTYVGITGYVWLAP